MLTAVDILTGADWTKSMPVANMLQQIGWCKSRNEARRLIKQGGIRINDSRLHDPFAFFVNHGQFTIIVQDEGNDINITTRGK